MGGGEFLRSYSDVPKFSLTVFVDIAHDNYNGLYEVDDLMYTMYRRLPICPAVRPVENGKRTGPVRPAFVLLLCPYNFLPLK